MPLLLRSWSSWFIIPGGPPPTAWTKAAAVAQFLFREVHIWYPLIIDGSCVDMCDVKSPGCHLELWYSCCTISVRNTWTQRRCSHTPINLPHSNQYDTPELSVVLQHIFSNISNLMTQWTNMCLAKRLLRLKLIGVNMSMLIIVMPGLSSFRVVQSLCCFDYALCTMTFIRWKACWLVSV